MTLAAVADAPGHVMRRPRYPEYQSVDISWLAGLPVGWTAPKLRFVCEVNPTTSAMKTSSDDLPVSFVPMEAVGEGGGLDLSNERPLSSVRDGYTYFEDGDVLVAKITPCFENKKGALAQGLTSGIGFGTTELHVLRPGPSADGRFLFYVTQSDHFRQIGAHAMYGAGGQKRVSTEFVEQFRHPFPELRVQSAIATYLDRETARIDTLIDRKQRLLALLEEKRTALITRAVTKGLDPDVPMKDSGVEWLGEVPEHWAIRRLKHLTRLITSGSRGWSEHFADQGAIFLQSGDLDGKLGVDLASAQRVNLPHGVEGVRTHLQPGDLVLCITGALTGNVGVVRALPKDAYVNQHLALVRLRDPSDAEFVGLALHSPSGQRHFELAQYGGTKQGLSLEDVAASVIPWPPFDERQTIVGRVRSRMQMMEELVTRIESAITLLREYRTALISAAVTGKIDVREGAA